MKYVNADIYQGNWAKNMKNGEGSLHFNKNKKIEDGQNQWF